MKRRILTIGSATILSLLVQVYGKTGGRQSQSAVASSDQAAAQRAIINQYCSTCHSDKAKAARSEEHTSELQSRPHLVCRLLLEKKKKHQHTTYTLIVNTSDTHSVC